MMMVTKIYDVAADDEGLMLLLLSLANLYTRLSKGATSIDIRLVGQFNIFPSISRIFLRWMGVKTYSQTEWWRVMV